MGDFHVSTAFLCKTYF